MAGVYGSNGYNQNYNHSSQPPPPPADDYIYNQGHARRYRKSAFLTLILAIIPGLNYMYLGLMKRGLFFMTVFFATTVIIRETGARLLGFGVFMLICYALFDGLRIRRLMMDGFAVPDATDDVVEFSKQHKKPLLLFLAVTILFGILGRAGRALIYMITGNLVVGAILGVALNFFLFILGVFIIVVGCYIIAKFAVRSKADKS